MKINKVNNSPNFEAFIKINKKKLNNSLLSSAGSSSVSGGAGTAITGSSSAADMIVHGSNSAVPTMQSSFSLFDEFAKYGHKIQDVLMKGEYEHNAYDASFFSTALSGTGSASYANGMNTIIKAIEKREKKIPS